MQLTAYSTSEKIKAFAWLFVLSFALWLVVLGSNTALPELFTGGVVCLVVSFFAAHLYIGLSLPPLSIKRILFFIEYVIVLSWEIIKANFDVAYRVLHPAMPIKPGIVVVRTSLKSDIGKLILANSITLTPGTFTLDVIGDKLLIHWINVKAEDIDGATDKIVEKFEKYLKVIFE